MVHLLMQRSAVPLAKAAVSRAGKTVSTPVARPMVSRSVVAHPGGRVRVQANKSTDFDFDAALATMAEKFEKADNKPALLGWGFAGLSVFLFSEWLIHLPLFNFLFGFPIQMLGLFMLPYLGVRYGVEGKDFVKDASEAVTTVTSKLPGFEKK